MNAAPSLSIFVVGWPTLSASARECRGREYIGPNAWDLLNPGALSRAARLASILNSVRRLKRVAAVCR